MGRTPQVATLFVLALLFGPACNNLTDTSSVGNHSDNNSNNVTNNTSNNDTNNGTANSGCLTVWHRDADGDTYGNPGDVTAGCDQPAGYVGNDDDCNDDNSGTHPEAIETCDGIDNNCNQRVDEGVVVVWFSDVDGDGFGDDRAQIMSCTAPLHYVESNTDCDDKDPAVSPAAEEHCDGEDEDCDGGVDEEAVDRVVWYLDSDGDGYGSVASEPACEAPDNHVAAAEDCDDSDPAIHPFADEDCEATEDRNCDGHTGEADGDGDGHMACRDCDDSNSSVFPGSLEICDGVVNDCDEPEAADGSGETQYDQPCDGQDDDECTDGVLVCDGSAFVCDDDLASSVETCNGVDDDCDGMIDTEDDDLRSAACLLQQGVCEGAIMPCVGGVERPCNEEVYVDHDPNYRAGTEFDCDDHDNNCDGTADEDCCPHLAAFQRITEGELSEYGPVAASIGTELLVAWQNDETTSQFVQTSGVPSRGPTTEIPTGVEIAAAGHDSHYVMVTTTSPQPTWALVTHDGGGLSDEGVLESLDGYTNPRDPAVDIQGSDFVAVMVTTPSEPDHTMGAGATLILWEGTDHSPRSIAGAPNLSYPDVAMSKVTDEWASVWIKGENNGRRLQCVTSASLGFSQGELDLHEATSRPKIVAADDRYVVTYVGRVNAEDVLFTMLLTDEGSLEDPIEIARAPTGTLTDPDLAITGSGIALAWVEESIVTYRPLSSTGEPAGAEMSLLPASTMPERSLAITAVGNWVLVINARQVGVATLPKIHSALISPEGNLLCPAEL